MATHHTRNDVATLILAVDHIKLATESRLSKVFKLLSCRRPKVQRFFSTTFMAQDFDLSLTFCFRIYCGTQNESGKKQWPINMYTTGSILKQIFILVEFDTAENVVFAFVRKMFHPACAKTWTGVWSVDYGLWTVF